MKINEARIKTEDVRSNSWQRVKHVKLLHSDLVQAEQSEPSEGRYRIALFPSHPARCSVTYHVNFRARLPQRTVSTHPFLFESFRTVRCGGFAHCYHRQIHTELFINDAHHYHHLCLFVVVFLYFGEGACVVNFDGHLSM